MDKKTSPLTYLIQKLLEQAAQQKHIPVKRTLKSGLEIVLSMDASDVNLIIYRNDTAPSDNELRTLLKYWPYYTGEVRVRNIVYNGRPALFAVIEPNSQPIKTEQSKLF